MRAAAVPSARLVDHLGDRGGESDLLQPALEERRIPLRQDPLARGVRHHDPANPEHGQDRERGLLGAPRLAPRLDLGPALADFTVSC